MGDLLDKLNASVADDELDSTCVHTEAELREYVAWGARVALEWALGEACGEEGHRVLMRGLDELDEADPSLPVAMEEDKA